jgi:hypothetical protein
MNKYKSYTNYCRLVFDNCKHHIGILYCKLQDISFKKIYSGVQQGSVFKLKIDAVDVKLVILSSLDCKMLRKVTESLISKSKIITYYLTICTVGRYLRNLLLV